jgi:hypothetical protein
MTVLVDSDILIGVSRGKDALLVAKWLDLSRSDALIRPLPPRSFGRVRIPVNWSTDSGGSGPASEMLAQI